MVAYGRLVAEKWGVPEPLATSICDSYEKGDWPYYLHDYQPEIAAEVELFQIWEIYDYLQSIESLESKKKRLLNALKKDGVLTEVLQHRVELFTDPYELDDMLVAHRPNPRSRAQTALKRGLGPLAELVIKQEEEQGTLEEHAQAYVGKDPALKGVDDVISGVRDILAERFAYDETVRAMAREFCMDDGYFTVTPKSRKDSRFSGYVGKELPVQELPREELLPLLWAEEQKQVRVKIGVQLFRITEMLRHHFLENPDSIGFDVICEAIDESWQRLLQSTVERDIKDKLWRDALAWAVGAITRQLSQQTESGTTSVAVGFTRDGRAVGVAISGEGRLLGASRDQRKTEQNQKVSDSVSKLLARYRPAQVIVVRTAEEDGDEAEQTVRNRVQAVSSAAEIAVINDPCGKTGICQSAWFKEKCADLDKAMKHVYGAGLTYIKPLNVVAEIGARYFDMHQLQRSIPEERMDAVVSRVATDQALHRGIPVRDVPDSVLQQFPAIPEGLLADIRSSDISKPFASKADLLTVEGMTETVYRNIAGYIVLPSAADALDTTLVHPYLHERLDEVASDLKVSTEGLVVNPSVLNAYACDDFAWQLYVRRNIPQQLSVGQRVAQTRQLPRRKLRLDELQEGMVVQGKVTNISAFGAFVNINAVCDGLIHVSQLADTYVENPQQVVSVGETVHVRVVSVDTKKRRISLSMKGLGNRAPRVRPSANHLNTLLDHFSNR